MGRWRFDSQHLPALPPFILRRQPPGRLTITHWLTHSASHISKGSHIDPKQLWGFIDYFLDTNFGISMLLIQDVHLVTNVEYSWQKCDSEFALYDLSKCHPEGQTCQECGLYFINWFKFECHMNQHRGLKPYACDYCEFKVWSRKINWFFSLTYLTSN